MHLGFFLQGTCTDSTSITQPTNSPRLAPGVFWSIPTISVNLRLAGKAQETILPAPSIALGRSGTRQDKLRMNHGGIMHGTMRLLHVSRCDVGQPEQLNPAETQLNPKKCITAQLPSPRWA